MALTDLPGVGPAMAAKLQAAGYEDERAVALAWPDEIAAATGRSLEQSSRWIDAARASMSGVAPAAAAAPEKEWLPASGRVVFGHIVMGVDLVYLALSVLGGLLLGLLLLFGADMSSFMGSGTADPEEIRSLLWLTNGLNFITFGLIPIVWLLATRAGGWHGMLDFLGLHWSARAAALGAGLGVAMVVVFGGLSYLLDYLELGPADAPIEDVALALNWPLVFVTSAVAGFAEEIMFRGVLQKWLRWWGQGLAFGLLHMGNAGIYSFVATAIIGVGLGYLRHRGWSLWALIIAHFVYDLILFSSVLLIPEGASESAGAWLGR